MMGPIAASIVFSVGIIAFFVKLIFDNYFMHKILIEKIRKGEKVYVELS